MTKIKKLSENAILQLEREKSIQARYLDRMFDKIDFRVEEKRKREKNKKFNLRVSQSFDTIIKLVAIAFISACFQFGYITYLSMTGTEISSLMIFFSASVTSIISVMLGMYLLPLQKEKLKND